MLVGSFIHWLIILAVLGVGVVVAVIVLNSEKKNAERRRRDSSPDPD